MRRTLACLFVISSLAVVLPTAASAANPRNTTRPTGANRHLRVLQANVGNVDLGCSDAFYKLCYQDAENRIAGNIAAKSPDVVFLQEVLPDWVCRNGAAAGSNKVCLNYQTRAVRDQARRLLGWDYSIVCDWWHGWDCIAVKNSAGSVQNDAWGRSCPPGYLCGSTTFSNGDSTATNEDPYFATYYAPYNSSSYDGGFHMLYVDAVLNGVPMRLIDGHPQSGGTGSGSKENARKTQINEAFTVWASGASRVLMSGDMNLDPYRNGSDVSVVEWRNYVDNYSSSGVRTDKTYWYHSGVAENGGTWWPKYTTSYLWPISNYTYDQVISNFTYGTCATLDSSNSSSPAFRLDGGSGCDHRALDCDLWSY